MARYIGRKRSIGIGKETVRGTVVASNYWIQHGDFDFEEKKEVILDESAIGIISDSAGQEMTKRWAEGNIGGNLSDQSIGELLLATLGAVSSAVKGGETIVYEHSFSVLDSNSHPSLTISLDEPNGDYDFANAMISSLELNVALGDYVKFGANVMAKKGTSATLTPAFVAENKFVSKHVCIFFASDLSGLDGASQAGGISADITFEKNVLAIDELCSVDPTDFVNQQLGATGNLEFYFEDEVEKAISLNNTAQAMRIRITDTSKTIGVGSNPTLDIDFAKVYLNELARSGSNNDIVTQSYSFQSVFSQGDASHVTAKLTNLITSY